jgi:hypothetical protein
MPVIHDNPPKSRRGWIAAGLPGGARARSIEPASYCDPTHQARDGGTLDGSSKGARSLEPMMIDKCGRTGNGRIVNEKIGRSSPLRKRGDGNLLHGERR